MDTLETVRALGVRRLIIAGLCGGFSPDIRVSDVVIPHKILSEEGTSRHYYEDVDFVLPEEASWDWGDPDFPRDREQFVEEVVRFSLQL